MAEPLPVQPHRGPAEEANFRLLVSSVTDYAIFLLDTGGYVRTWNAGAERMKGYRAPEIIGRHFSTFYTPEDIARGWPAEELRRAADEGRLEDEGWRVRKDGSRFWANVVITALRDESGRLVGYGKVTRDLTERRAHEERLRLSEERFRLLIEGVQDYAIYMLDPAGIVTSWNTGAERILGYRMDEIVGRPFSVFYPPDDAAAGRPRAEIRDALLYGRAQDTGWRQRKDGSRFWAEVVVTALRDSGGHHVGFAKVVRDLSQQRRMEELEEAGRHTNEFLAMLAHELRNPLAPIRNAVGILTHLPSPDPRADWCRDVIDRQSHHLSRLVDDLLDVSRITRGKLRLQSAPMDLSQAIHRAVEAVRPLVEARRHELKVDLPHDPVTVHGDVTRLAQVVSNLLTNAAKYTPEGGHIGIELRREGREAVLRVRDNGIGILPANLEHVFDLFSQGERGLDRSAGGLGIGLTLARRLVVLHGGTLVAASAGAGQGAEFTVRLPLASSERPDDHEGSAAGELSTGPRHKVLVVDDNADSAASLAMLLQISGHEVETVTEGRAALDCLAAFQPDIVFLDIGLPGLTGYDVVKAMRESPRGRAMRIYAMTGYGQEEDRRRSIEAGFDGHLVKPVALEEIAAAIDKLGPGD